MFKITEGKGFHIEFENGVNLSVQFGKFNYCENKITKTVEFKKSVSGYIKEENTESFDAEIGIWDKKKNWITEEIYKKIYKKKLKDVVVGYVNADEFAKFVYYCQKYKN